MAGYGVTETSTDLKLGSGLSLRSVAVVFAFTTFLSAFLLFQVQLIISKYILPWFGGTSAVWTTSLLVFQILLLGGYVYSHYVCERLAPRTQSKLHLGLLAAAVLLVVGLSLAWPSAITPGLGWRPLNSQKPVLDVVTILLVSTGVPFFVLSTTGPLLQGWFARQGGDARTYRLYAVSNLGSLLGLLAFPFLLEPTLRMTSQGRLWAALFCVYAAGCGWCAWRFREGATEPVGNVDAVQTPMAETTAGTRTLWFLLPACASALLLATTNLLCQEITSFPLLWVLPLALYLLSFILTFDHPRWYRRDLFHPLFVLGIAALWAAMQFGLRNSQVLIMPALLFVVCVTCHGELARLKPPVRQLTAFYLAVSAGGALGGVFVALIAPQIFVFFTEFQAALAVSTVLVLWCLVRDRGSWFRRIGLGLSAAIVGGVFVAARAGSLWVPQLQQYLLDIRFYPIAVLIATLVLIGAYLQRATLVMRAEGFRAGQVLVLVLAAWMMAGLYATVRPDRRLYEAKRNFYGELRVYEMSQGGKALMHGQTLHGAQLNPPNDRLPMAYYGPESGIGIVLRNHPQRSAGKGGLRVGVAGMGAGTLAAYGGPNDTIRYYEINPDVIELASGTNPVFTYVRDSQARVETQLGDGRLLLEREIADGKAQNFDVLVLDAFSGDAVPVHLLTAEAFDMYWKHVNPDHGLIAVHVSSQHINLMPVLEGLSQQNHWPMLVRAMHAGFPYMDNLWVILARRPEDLEMKGLTANPPPMLSNAAPRVWTDDYSDIVRLLY